MISPRVALFFLLIIYQCSSQCTLLPFNFQPISNSSFSIPWTPPQSQTPQTISFAPCASGIPSGCGAAGPPLNQCYNTPACCAVCQSWQEDSGSVGACLGLSSNLQSITQVSSNEVKITYGRGDLVQTTPRQVDIYITCDSNAGKLTFVNFTEATPLTPPPPAYVYTLNLSSSIICSASGSCVLPGYHFNYISAFQNWSSSWTPPGASTPETISYAPCSSGISSGCGIEGSPMNQCGNKPNCCAVCESWKEDTGTQSACLGLSHQLMAITAISNLGVKITYGGGDTVDGTERRVDVMILCDPRSTLLTFVDFIIPQPQNPPPPYYEYVLVLSSSDLCGASDDVEVFVEKIIKFL